MKANISRASAGNQPFHSCPLRLTIGVIARDSAKTLGKCLESVKPLLEAVPAELIVTDTGSTDATVEIAGRYTDHILHFPWCDDFSAARNTGLDAAKGEWFLFLDADEWFEDVSELIAFFRGPECDRYGSGCYVQRNYRDTGGKEYSDFHAVRIFRRYPGIRFEHTVHESVRWLRPIRFFNAYVHHYGYAFHTPEEKRTKVERNLNMLEKALEKTPDDLKLLYQLSRQYFTLQKYDRIIECCRKGLEEERKQPQREWRLSFYSVLSKAYYDSRRYREVISAVCECERSDEGVELPYLDYYLLETFSYFYLREYGEAVDAAERYEHTFESYSRGELNNEYLLFGNDIGIDLRQHENAAVVLVRSLAALEKYEKAARRFEQIDLSAADVAGQDISALCLVLAEKTGDFESVPRYYRRILAADDLAKKNDFIAACEEYRKQRPEYGEAVVRALAVSDCGDNYVVMNRIRAAGTDRGVIQKLLGLLTPDRMEWNIHYADVPYLAMKSGADITGLLDTVDRDLLPSLVREAEREHPDSLEVFFEYLGSHHLEGLKGLFWRICLEERVLLGYRNFSSGELLSWFRSYVNDLNECGRKTYRGELFTEQGASLLPGRIRFGWHMQRAFEQEGGNGAEYVGELRKALESFPAMKEPINLLLNNFEEKSEQGRKRSEEFADLTGKVKNQIESLIQCGRLEEAGRITRSLAKLIPEDDDLRRYRKLTHTEPSLRELAAGLPQ